MTVRTLVVPFYQVPIPVWQKLRFQQHRNTDFNVNEKCCLFPRLLAEGGGGEEQAEGGGDIRRFWTGLWAGAAGQQIHPHQAEARRGILQCEVSVLARLDPKFKAQNAVCAKMLCDLMFFIKFIK